MDVSSSHVLLVNMYRTMLLIRIVEERIAELLESEEIECPTHLCTGQEAIPAGVCAALRQTDLAFGTHRSHGHYLAKGGSLDELVSELFGKGSGCSRGRGGSMHLIAPQAGFLGAAPIVSGTIALAVGAALASKLSDEPRVVVPFFGDGAADEGVFHEALNIASLMELPVVFVCENNLFSTHLHVEQRRASRSIKQVADAHEITSSQIDGNDVETVHLAAAEAVERARTSRKPSLLECMTYRWRGHVGPKRNENVGLRRSEELPRWFEKDPLVVAERRLVSSGEMTDGSLARLKAETEGLVDQAIARAREAQYPPADELCRYVFCDSAREETLEAT